MLLLFINPETYFYTEGYQSRYRTFNLVCTECFVDSDQRDPPVRSDSSQIQTRN